jgi:LmbE family N-acetylglucosaminyl deacetylase
MTILILAAHPDDEVIGVGGTAAKYHEKRERIVAIIFSLGETSHPWMKKEIIKKEREKEAQRAHKRIGISEAVFLGLTDGKIKKEIKKKKIDKILERLIRKYKPDKIFTHSADDPHPDHRAVYNLTVKVVDRKKKKPDVYAYEIWNPLTLIYRNKPRLYVDITKTYKDKLRAMDCFKTQKTVMAQMIPRVYFTAIFDGVISKCKYAEKFIKIR